MEINKKSRAELKAYFVKNALPTESNFKDLIDAGLNQKDDGIVKAADQPVHIAASTAGDKPAIHLYESFATDTKPAWVLSVQAGGKKGFGIGDGDGNNRLFIDATTGGVGIGTADPAGNKLRVAGNVLIDGADGGASLSFGSSTRQMLNLSTAAQGIGVQSSTTYFRSSSNFAFYKGGVHSDGALDPGTGGAAMLVIKDGNVGIGTTDPAGYKLKVAGNTRIEGTLEINQEAWKNATLLNAWAPYDPTALEFSSAAYFKDTCGIVHLRGIIKGGNINSSPPTGTIFLLPAGYRPQYHQICMTSTYPGNAPTNIGGRIDIYPDGQVVAYSGYNAWFCLDGVTFRAV